MDFLQQNKLTRDEWLSIERPISDVQEKRILNMIDSGYNDISQSFLSHVTICEYLKVDNEHDIDIYLLIFEGDVKKYILKYDKSFNPFNILGNTTQSNTKKVKKSDKIKLESSLSQFMSEQSNKIKEYIVEFKVIKLLKSLMKLVHKQSDYKKHNDFGELVYNLSWIQSMYPTSLNKYISVLMSCVLKEFNPYIKNKLLLKNVDNILEHNDIHKYKRFSLHNHQKDIYSFSKNNRNDPKFVWYCAPTSTGKTLSPIGLSNDYVILFLCASKHIGLNFARNAYSCKKKIGFAFGCNDIEDIRLQFNAVNSYNISKSGKKTPDNSDGTKVQILVSDLKSFEVSMLYLKAFNPVQNILLFWDEPTIGLDVETHILHDVIKRNWELNCIPNVIFSCATLPNQQYIENIINDFSNKFSGALFKNIDSSDLNTNIMIYDEYANVVLPHNVFVNGKDFKEFNEINNTKYFKFYNCKECANFILFISKYFQEMSTLQPDWEKSIKEFNMINIKKDYINILENIATNGIWDSVMKKFNEINKKYTSSNPNPYIDISTQLTTTSASSLTNGPTLYFTGKSMNICKYFLHIAQIDNNIIKNILNKISFNNKVANVIQDKEKDYEDRIEKFKDNDKMMMNMRLPQDVLDLNNELNQLRSKIVSLSIDPLLIPNTKDHFTKWKSSNKKEYHDMDLFCSSIDEESIKLVSRLYEVPDEYKLLLLMGIGVFDQNIDANEQMSKYIDTMKSLAERKCLYMIIAGSDYIYGINYQFSHCYIGKDLDNMSQEKIIQCIGRIGRQIRNKHFSFRFRTKTQIDTFYSLNTNSIEVKNMNRLFIRSV